MKREKEVAVLSEIKNYFLIIIYTVTITMQYSILNLITFKNKVEHLVQKDRNLFAITNKHQRSFWTVMYIICRVFTWSL